MSLIFHNLLRTNFDHVHCFSRFLLTFLFTQTVSKALFVYPIEYICILLYHTVVYPRVPSIPNCTICTPTREMNMMTRKGYVHEYIYIYIYIYMNLISVKMVKCNYMKEYCMLVYCI